jgi:DNA-binding NtrC family response regulator
MSQDSSSITVLHLDRDQAFLEAARRILTILGNFKVDSVQTTKEANQLLKQIHYDVVISAYYLNDVNGLDFLHQLKQSGVKSTFVLFSVNEETAEQAAKAGIQFVGKYGDPEKVFAQLCQALKNCRQ